MRPLSPGADLVSREANKLISIPESSVIVNSGLSKYAKIVYDAGNKGTHSQLEFFNLPTSFICLVKTTTV